jgi:hypothetical protein
MSWARTQLKAGELFRVYLRVTRPCWDDGAMHATLSWPSEALEYVDRSFGPPGWTVTSVANGTARAELHGPHGAGAEVALEFRALRGGNAEGILIDEVDGSCSTGGSIRP